MIIKNKMKIQTIYKKGVFDSDECVAMYEYLKENISWDDGIPSRIHGFTRKAKTLSISVDSSIKNFVCRAIGACNHPQLLIDNVLGVYLNYQRDGNDYTPNHSHKNSIQLVIAFGATREFIIGSKKYMMESGDVIVFGSSIHGVPKNPEIKDGRISIATFADFF